MNSTVVVALISFAGTLLGTAGGIIASSKLVNYRLEQLEKKVDAHNTVASRVPVIEEKIKTIKNIAIGIISAAKNSNNSFILFILNPRPKYLFQMSLQLQKHYHN